MFAAAYCGTVDDIKKCLEKGADVNAKTEEGYTPLMYAVMFNSSEAVKFLIDNGADVHARNFQYQTALSLVLCVYKRLLDLDVIKELANAGADVNAVFDDGSTVLMRAVCECYSEDGLVILKLIECGADVNFVRKDGETALTLAYKNENFGAVRQLIIAGADISSIV